MRNRGLLMAGVVLLLANGVILVNVKRNRAGNPDAVVRLSERELRTWMTPERGAEAMLDFRLSWETGLGPDGAATWFDRSRLEALGAKHLPAVGDTTWEPRGPADTRQGFAVLELAGPAWVRWAALKQAQRDSMMATRDSTAAPAPAEHVHGPAAASHESGKASRLMAVDVGTDPVALREKYPDRSIYLILPATYQADITPPVRDTAGVITIPTQVNGRISQLLPGTVHVPRPLRDSLIGLGALKHDSTTRFEVTFKVGKRWEGWVE